MKSSIFFSLLLAIVIATPVAAAAPAAVARSWSVWIEDGKGADGIAFTGEAGRSPFDNYYEQLLALCWYNVGKGPGEPDPLQRPNYQADSMRLSEIGPWEGFRVFDLLNMQIPHRGIVLQDGNGDHRVLYAQFFAGADYQALPQIMEVAGESLLAYRASIDGTGSYFLEYYFYSDQQHQRVRRVDLSVIDRAIADTVPEGHGVWKGGGLNFPALSYRNEVWKEGDANCCPSGGSIAMKLELADGQLRVVEAKYAPTESER